MATRVDPGAVIAPSRERRPDAADLDVWRRGPWWRRHPLPVHAAVLAALVIVVAPVTNIHVSGWIDDEGLYALQAISLQEGRWDWDYAGASFDPEGQWFPFGRAERVGDRYFPYVKHPVYALILAGGARAFGTGLGIYAVPMLGLVLAAVVAWLLAAEFEPRAGPVAFWLTATSPLVMSAYVLWAHSLGAAIAGGAMLAAVRILRRGMTGRRLLAMAILLGFGILLRAELVLFALALGVALAGRLAYRARAERLEWERAAAQARRHRRRRGGGLPPPPDRASARAAGAVGLVCLSVTTVAVLFERWLAARVVSAEHAEVLGTGGPASIVTRAPLEGRALSEFFAARMRAFWRITFSGSEDTADASFPILIGVALLIGVVLLWRELARSRRGPVVVVAVAVAVCGLYALRMRSYPEESVHGLFAAWPAALPGLLLLPWRHTGAGERMLGVALLSFAAAVYATQYDIGGAVEWGGRFLSPVALGLAVVIAVGLVRRLRAGRLTTGMRRALAVLAVAVLVAPVTTALWMRHTYHAADRPFIEDVASVATRTVVIDSELLAHRRFPKLAWRLNQHHDLFRARPDDVADLLDALYAHGFDEVTLIHAAVDPIAQRSPFSEVEDVTPPWTRSLGGAIHVLRREDPSHSRSAPS